jgi:hypothetical protein
MYGNYCVSCEPPSQADYSAAIADWAKLELLKEKVKARIDAKYGPKLDRMADLIVEVIEERHAAAGRWEAREEELSEGFDFWGNSENQ